MILYVIFVLLALPLFALFFTSLLDNPATDP